MKTSFKYTIYCLLTMLLANCSNNININNNNETQSYNQLERQGVKIIDPFIDSEIDFSKNPNYQIKVKQKKTTKDTIKKAAPKNKTKFTEANNQELELINYDSGLKCQILRNGPSNSPLPKKGQTVCTHYIGWHNDHGAPGELIDSTYERSLPFSFKIGENKVIKAWDEAVMDMRVGDKRRLFIPSELAWGKAGATKLIPSNTDLIYEIEVISIK